MRKHTANTPMIQLDIVFNFHGKPCATLMEYDRGIWVFKPVNPARHMLLKPLGYATDKRHLDLLRERNGQGVRLLPPDGVFLAGLLEDFDKYGLEFERGHGGQVVLPLDRWRRLGDDEQLTLFAAPSQSTPTRGAA